MSRYVGVFVDGEFVFAVDRQCKADLKGNEGQQIVDFYTEVMKREGVEVSTIESESLLGLLDRQNNSAPTADND